MFVDGFIILSLIFLVIYWFHQKPKNLPPGEWGFPIVGYVPFMDKKITISFEKLQKKHGKIFSVKLGARIFIILGDYKLIKVAFQKPELSGRPTFYNYEVVRKNYHLGLILSNGQAWSTNRRFALRTLRDFGLGKAKVLDDIITNEAQSLVNDLSQKVGKEIAVDWSVNVATLNVMFSLIASRHYEVYDEEIKIFAKYLNDNIEDMDGELTVFALFPWMIPLVPRFVKDWFMHQSRIEEKREKILDLLQNIINEHRITVDPNNAKDYIDKYIIECEQQQKDNPEYQHCGDKDLLSNVFDFFIAGSETASSTIRWFFLYMGRFPETQKRVQKEIDEFVPRDKLPSLHDKDNLPCLEALTYEINRVVALLPYFLPHEALEDTTLENYVIPKGAVVLPNMPTCHKDPHYWKHPNTFSIDNFLDDEGKMIRNKEGYLAFGIGRHQCLGESLAKMDLFIFMGAILQNFEIVEPKGQSVPLRPLEIPNILNLVPKFKVILKKRN